MQEMVCLISSTPDSGLYQISSVMNWSTHISAGESSGQPSSSLSPSKSSGSNGQKSFTLSKNPSPSVSIGT